MLASAGVYEGSAGHGPRVVLTECDQGPCPRRYEVDSPHDRDRAPVVEGAMAKLIAYKGFVIEPNSYKLKAGAWVPRAWVIVDTSDRLTMHSVYSKIQRCATEEAADAAALELAKLWVEKND